jgi:CBS domain-containing protein
MTTAFVPSHRNRPLHELRVTDVMHPGMVSCPPDASLSTVARLMVTYRVHAIFIHAHGDDLAQGESWAVVTDADLVRAAFVGDLETTAASIAAAPVLAVSTAEPLEHAMQLMTEHEVAHVVVLEGRSGRPVGVVSTLDIARAVAGLA